LLTVPNQINQFVAVKLDLASYQWWRLFWLSLEAMSLAATVLMVIFIFADYGLKLKEQERAFAAVDTIMSDVPAPYARVDVDGKFIKINDAFGRLMGYGSANEAFAALRTLTYEDFLVDEASEAEYQKIKEERRDGMPYRSYLVQLWVGGGPGKGPTTWVRVHGGDVPTPHAARNKPGQSFGILLKTDPPKPKAVKDDKLDEEIVDRVAGDRRKVP
jgi:PAS domain-containing protein